MKNLGKSVLMLLAAALAACSDGSVAPPSQRVTGPSAVGGSTADLTQVDTTEFSFVIDPSRTTSYYLGAGNTIVFPAGSLCDPATSSYGMGHWDDPCNVATAPLTVNAKAWLDRHGHPRVDFDQQIRFVPGNDPTKWVVISFTDYAEAYVLLSSVLYCPNVNAGHCIDESKSDPTLVTYKDPITGRMSRRIKHFSGYNVFSGQPCDPSPDDPDCIDDGSGDGLTNRVPTATASFNSVSELKSVQGLVRDHPLPDHPTSAADIGPSGGSFGLPQAGLTVIVPPGAVNQVTHFSVTSTGGKVVAYEFEPHGTRFNVPLVLIQNLRGTAHKYGGRLIGAYFADASQVNPFGGSSLVNETLNATIDAQGAAEILIWHFSGYMLAWG